MKKNVKTMSEDVVVKDNNTELVAAGITIAIASTAAVISAVHEMKMDKWKNSRYEKWNSNFYCKIEETLKDINSSYNKKAHEIVSALIKRFFSAPSKKLAEKSLDTIESFICKLNETDDNNKKAAIILEYAAKYITFDVVTVKKYDYCTDLSNQYRY